MNRPSESAPVVRAVVKDGPGDNRATKEEQSGAQALHRELPDEPNLSENEGTEILRFADRRRNRQRAAKAQVRSKPHKPLDIDFASPVEFTRFMSAFGTSELAHAYLMLNGIVNAVCEGSPANPPSERQINQALAAVTGIGARDEIEGMLATQMVATHVASIKALRLLKGSETILQQDSNGSLAVKLLRTFAAQVEALQRYRGKGQQKVTVEHVHVHAGGQAIVGAVTQGGRGAKKTEGPDAARGIAYEPITPLRSPDPERELVPIAGRPGKTPM
jgi:hypothetical protein